MNPRDGQAGDRRGVSDAEAHDPRQRVGPPDRLIYYGGTAPGNDAKDTGIWFIAYDVKNNKLLKGSSGFARYCILSNSTGCVYWQVQVDGRR